MPPSFIHEIPYSHLMGYLCMFVGALWFLARYACFQYETWHIAGVCLILICWYNMRHGTYGVYLILICFAIWTCVMSLGGGNACCHSYPFLGIAQIASPRWLVNPLCRPPCCTMHQPKENHMAETNRGRALPLLSPTTINRNNSCKNKATCELSNFVFYVVRVFAYCISE